MQGHVLACGHLVQALLLGQHPGHIATVFGQAGATEVITQAFLAGAALAAIFPDKADVRQYMRESRTYGRAEGYDMQVVYVPGTGRIDEIVFARKQ